MDYFTVSECESGCGMKLYFREHNMIKLDLIMNLSVTLMWSQSDPDLTHFYYK